MIIGVELAGAALCCFKDAQSATMSARFLGLPGPETAFDSEVSSEEAMMKEWLFQNRLGDPTS